MNRWRRRAGRGGAALALLLLFFVSSLLASRLPATMTLTTSVQTVALADYSADPLQRLAPLSPRIIAEARGDTTPGALSARATTPTAAPRATATPRPSSAATATPSPTSLPTPTPTPTATPTPRPAPSPTPTPVPLPSATPLPLVGSTIAGTIVSVAGGTPIAGAQVTTLAASSSTDARGAYAMAVVGGPYSVTAAAPGYVSQTKGVTAPAGGSVRLDFQLQPVLAAIKGTVVNNLTGLGISGATLALTPSGATTTAAWNGSFSFASVAPGSYTLTVTASGYTTATETVQVAPGQTLTLTVRLRTLLGI